METATSTPESTVVIDISFGKGTGERLESSMAQFNAMTVKGRSKVDKVTARGCDFAYEGVIPSRSNS
jgi:hypothetical protein